MNLFELDNAGNLLIDPIAYTLVPFKTLWDRDKSKTKNKAIKELAYVFYTCDYKSPYAGNTSLEDRDKEVIRGIYGTEQFTPDEAIKSAQEFYRERQKTFSLILLEDAIIGIKRLSTYLRDINFDQVIINETTGKITPKHDIKKYADTVKTIPDILKSLNTLQEAVMKEQESNESLRGGRKKGMYAD